MSYCTESQNPLNEAGGLFGSSVSSAGDVNGDGYADVVVGSRDNDGGTGALSKGVAYIFYGSSTGTSSHPLNAIPYTCSGPGDCTEIQNPLHEASGNFAISVRIAGDVNGDGYADVLVGARNNDGGIGAADKGVAYIFYGSATGATTHTLSASPYPCIGPSDCTVIQNPLNQATGLFGNSVGYLAPNLRPAPARLESPALPSRHVGRHWWWGQDALLVRREEDIA